MVDVSHDGDHGRPCVLLLGLVGVGVVELADVEGDVLDRIPKLLGDDRRGVVAMDSAVKEVGLSSVPTVKVTKASDSGSSQL